MTKVQQSVVIVGAGVAGLAAAAFLGRHGVKVTVIEASENVGGCVANTVIDGFTFHDGAQFLTMPRLLDRLFDRIGIDRETALPLHRISGHRIQVGSTQVVFHGGDRVTTSGSQLGLADDEASAQLARLIAVWRPVMNMLESEVLERPLSLPRLLLKGARYFHLFARSLPQELARHLTHADLQAALAATLQYVFVPPAEMPALFLGGAATALDQGMFVPHGGMGRVSEVLMQAVSTFGGTLLRSTRVHRILLSNGKVCGVDLESHGQFPASAVISCVSGMATLGELLGPNDISARLRRRAKQAPLSARVVNIQLGLRNRLSTPWYLEAKVPALAQQHECLRWPGGPIPYWSFVVPTTAAPELAPAAGSIIDIFPPLPDIDPMAWDGPQTSELVKRTLDAVSKEFPLDVAVTRVRTPTHFCEQMNLYGGAVYGLDPRAFSSMFPRKPGPEGLYLAGQTTHPGAGVVASALSGVMAGEAVLKRLA